MKRVSSIFVALLLILGTVIVPTEVKAGGCGSHGGCAPVYNTGCNRCGGGHGPGFHGRPVFYGRFGRYPLVGFRAPIRRSLGLPGFTPVRQFLFGRGHIRRVNRRAFLFGF